MINSASDYEYVDVTGHESCIKGGIMPKRSGGAKKAMRYEDYLFLMEGLLERQNWMQRYGAPAKTRPWLGRMAGFGAWAWNLVAKAKTEGLEHVRIGETGPGNFCDAEQPIPTNATSPTDWQHDFRDAIARVADRKPHIEELEFKAGKPMKKDDLEKAFRNLKKLTRTWVNFSDYYGYIWGETKHRTHRAGRRQVPDAPTVDVFEDYDEPGEWEDGPGAPLYSHSSTGEHKAFPDDDESDVWWSAAFAEHEWRLGTLDWFPYAKSAKAVMVMNTWWSYEKESGGTESESHDDAFTVDVTVREGMDGRSVLDFSSINMDGLIANALSRNGLPVRHEPTNVPWEEQQVDISAMWLIVDNEFPATPE